MENEAIDRRQLRGHALPVKTSRWPRTPRRQARIERALARRQPDLTVVLEDVHDAHNVSAVLRSCDAVGAFRIHVVYQQETAPDGAFARTTSGSAAKWVPVERHADITSCYAALRAQGMTILATALRPESVSLYGADLARPVALVFGNEMRGLSEAAIAGADCLVALPMMGMVQSLNVSVACAVTLYEALRQRVAAGAYNEPRLPEIERAALVEEWLKR